MPSAKRSCRQSHDGQQKAAVTDPTDMDGFNNVAPPIWKVADSEPGIGAVETSRYFVLLCQDCDITFIYFDKSGAKYFRNLLYL